MVRSMTGFGRAENSVDGTTVTVEISSVNGRYHDIKAKIPRSLNEYENKIRAISQDYIERGRINCIINIESSESGTEQLTVDYNLARQYINLAQELSARFDITGSLDARTILAMPDVLTRTETTDVDDAHWDIVEQTLHKALESHQDMRGQEGSALAADMEKRIFAINNAVDDIVIRVPEIVAANTERMKRKLHDLLDGTDIDESRFAMEVALYTDKIDVTEECVRLKSHTNQFLDELKSPESSGRKLSFLLQEMHREANTIGSKILDAGISQVVVGIKEELEKIREQSSNVE